MRRKKRKKKQAWTRSNSSKSWRSKASSRSDSKNWTGCSPRTTSDVASARSQTTCAERSASSSWSIRWSRRAESRTTATTSSNICSASVDSTLWRGRSWALTSSFPISPWKRSLRISSPRMNGSMALINQLTFMFICFQWSILIYISWLFFKDLFNLFVWWSVCILC